MGLDRDRRRSVHYSQVRAPNREPLSLEDRGETSRGKSPDSSDCDVAEWAERYFSEVNREITSRGYRVAAAQQRLVVSRCRSKPREAASASVVAGQAHAGLARYWSPRQRHPQTQTAPKAPVTQRSPDYTGTRQRSPERRTVARMYAISLLTDTQTAELIVRVR